MWKNEKVTKQRGEGLPWNWGTKVASGNQLQLRWDLPMLCASGLTSPWFAMIGKGLCWEKHGKISFFHAEKVCMLFLAVGLLAFAAQKEGILRDLLILSACSLSWKMVRAQFTAVNGFFRQNCVLLHSAGQCQINQYCGMNILVLPWGYKGEINNPPSNYWRNLRKLSTYQMKNNHVGKQRPCFCNLRNIIPNSGILVYPIISLYYG